MLRATTASGDAIDTLRFGDTLWTGFDAGSGRQSAALIAEVDASEGGAQQQPISALVVVVTGRADAQNWSVDRFDESSTLREVIQPLRVRLVQPAQSPILVLHVHSTALTNTDFSESVERSRFLIDRLGLGDHNPACCNVVPIFLADQSSVIDALTWLNAAVDRARF